MDAKAILEKSKALQKAQQAGEPASVITGILNELKKGVVANEELLRSTKIGVVVAKAKQHKNPEVSRLASDIVRKWRDEVEKQRGGSSSSTKKAGSGAPLASPRTPGTASSSGGASPDKAKAGSGSAVPPEQRSWKKDKMDTSKTSSAARNSCLGLLYDGLVFQMTAPAEKVLAVAQAVEAAIYATCGPEDKPAYKAKVRQLFQNLKNKSNAALRAQVVSAEIKPAALVDMSEKQLASDERRKADAQLAAENMRDAQVGKEPRSESKELQCGKCGMRRVAYTQAQTRSADEPMTTFCECVNCGKRWKFS